MIPDVMLQPTMIIALTTATTETLGNIDQSSILGCWLQFENPQYLVPSRKLMGLFLHTYD